MNTRTTNYIKDGNVISNTSEIYLDSITMVWLKRKTNDNYRDVKLNGASRGDP